MNKYNNALLSLKKGIMNYVDMKINKACYTSNETGIIKSIEIDTYTVSINKIDYKNLSSLNDISYQINDIVIVQIPNAQYNNMFILGKLS